LFLKLLKYQALKDLKTNNEYKEALNFERVTLFRLFIYRDMLFFFVTLILQKVFIHKDDSDLEWNNYLKRMFSERRIFDLLLVPLIDHFSKIIGSSYGLEKVGFISIQYI